MPRHTAELLASSFSAEDSPHQLRAEPAEAPVLPHSATVAGLVCGVVGELREPLAQPAEHFHVIHAAEMIPILPSCFARARSFGPSTRTK